MFCRDICGRRSALRRFGGRLWGRLNRLAQADIIFVIIIATDDPWLAQGTD